MPACSPTPSMPFSASASSTAKTALITGITGQDGSYLAELLLEKGYQVHGIKRRASSFNTSRIDHLYQDPHESDPRLVLHYGDLTDSTNLIRIIQQVRPGEIYNRNQMKDDLVRLLILSRRKCLDWLSLCFTDSSSFSKSC